MYLRNASHARNRSDSAYKFDLKKFELNHSAISDKIDRLVSERCEIGYYNLKTKLRIDTKKENPKLYEIYFKRLGYKVKLTPEYDDLRDSITVRNFTLELDWSEEINTK